MILSILLYFYVQFVDIKGTYGYYPGYMQCTTEVPCFGFLFQNITLTAIGDNFTDWFCGGNTYAINVIPAIPISCL